MKKLICMMLCLTVLLCLYPASVRAEGNFTLDEDACAEGMDRSYRQGYTPSVRRDVMTLLVPVRVPDGTGKPKAILIPENSSVFPGKPDAVKASVTQSDDERCVVRLEIPLFSDRTNGDYPCGLQLESENCCGDIPLVIRIRDGKANPESFLVMLENVESTLIPGQDGTVKGTLRNTSSTQAMTNVLLSVSDPAGDILPTGSDRLVLPDLLPGQETSFTFPMTVAGSADIRPHPLTWTVDCLTSDQSVSWTQNYTVTLRPEMRLENGGVQIPSLLTQGDPAEISLELMNMGKADIANAMMTLDLPGIASRKSTLVGTLLPGETKTGKLLLTPGKDIEGDVSGTVTVSYEDAAGKSESFILDVHTTVEAAKPYPVQEKKEEKQILGLAPAMFWALITCAILIAALILQGLVLRRKIARLEEERL